MEFWNYFQMLLIIINNQINEGVSYITGDTYGLYFDTRDNNFNSFKGYYFSFVVQDLNKMYNSNDRESLYRYHISIMKDFYIFYRFMPTPIILEIRFLCSLTNPHLQIYGWKLSDINFQTRDLVNSKDNLYLGGMKTVRGWGENNKELPPEWSYGGLHRILYGYEIKIPIWQRYITLFYFYDMGCLWQRISKITLFNKDYIASNGVGIRFFLWGILPIEFVLAQRLRFNGLVYVPIGSITYNIGIGIKRYY